MAHQALTSLQDSTSPLALLSRIPAATTRMAFGNLAVHFQGPQSSVATPPPLNANSTVHTRLQCAGQAVGKAFEEQQDVV